MRLFLRLENEQKSCAILVTLFRQITLQIADEISVAVNNPFELARRDIQSINAQWTLDLANSVADEIPQKRLYNWLKSSLIGILI